MPTLERALQIAVHAHAGQKDKSGAAYIFHPIRVMMRCCSPEAKIVGLLHDVVEDTPVTFEELEAEGFSKEVLAALRLLTHASEVPYADYIEHVKTNSIATEPSSPTLRTTWIFDACRRLTRRHPVGSRNTWPHIGGSVPIND